MILFLLGWVHKAFLLLFALTLRRQLQDAGFGGVVLFSAVYMVATVAFVPGTILTLGGGFAFAQAYGQGGMMLLPSCVHPNTLLNVTGHPVGILIASAATIVGAFFGAVFAFLLGRYALRDTVSPLYFCS